MKNGYGIHCRPSSVVAMSIKGYTGKISVFNSKGQEADPRSILALLSLTLTCGDAFSVVVEGPDEAEVCDRVVQALEKEYDFQRKEQ